MATLVSLNQSGAIIPLAPGNPVSVGAGANSISYAWSTLWNMSNTDLQALNIFKVEDPVQSPANNQVVTGVVYEHVNNAIVATSLYTTIPTPVVNTSNEFIRAELGRQAVQSCLTITTQIVPDQIHQNAYLNASAMLGPSATIPTIDPIKTQFNNLAASVGLTPSQFANVAIEVAATSFALSAALITLQISISSANGYALTTAKETFETSLTGIVNSLNASGLIINVSPPAPISIPGMVT